jgi:hypothetical protein
MPRRRTTAPALPQLLQRKIYKTGQTRGADDDVIYQNRVGRNSTVLIPYTYWESCQDDYENGYIVLISPAEYFGTQNMDAILAAKGLEIGRNTLVFYETREQWNSHNPVNMGWVPATSRSAPLGGSFVARVPATTAMENGGKTNMGFTQTAKKGAGIRVYEYASSTSIGQCRLQLEALYWMCHDAVQVATENGMSDADAVARKDHILTTCADSGLLDLARLQGARMLDHNGNTICPLCLEELSGKGFFSRMEQAEGREVPDITVTHINLFHIQELRTGVLNHIPYNLGWGHHHCNVVVKDSGITETLDWMVKVIDRNVGAGYLPATSNKGI